MSELETMVMQIKMISMNLQLQLAKGELKFDDTEVQHFIPVCMELVESDFLKIIAENILIEEDSKIVCNFIDQVEALAKVNGEMMGNEVKKMER